MSPPRRAPEPGQFAKGLFDSFDVEEADGSVSVRPQVRLMVQFRRPDPGPARPRCPT